MSFLLYALPGNEALAKNLVKKLDAEVGKLEVRYFPDGEAYVRVVTDPKGRAVILVATLYRPEKVFFPLVFAADTLRELGAVEVGLVAPYLAYMRQDRRFKEGEAVTSETFARLVNKSVDWLVTVDPHLHRRKSLSEIYTIPTATLHAARLIGHWLKTNYDDILLVGPDSESEQWVQAVAQVANAPFIILEKTRYGDRDVDVSVPHAKQWASRKPVLVDDIISTARTMIETVHHVHDAGLKPPICIGVHAVFAGDAYEALQNADVAQIVTCNSIAHPSNRIDLSGLIANSIGSLSKQSGVRS